MKRSPAAAFWLSLLPGVGHLYLGQFAKGLVIPLIVGGLINIVDRGADGLGILIPVFWLAVMLDAHRTAQEINVAIDRGMQPTQIDYRLGKWWGWVLIGLGVVFTLSNFNLIRFDWLIDLWPIALVVLGIRILRRPGADSVIDGIPPAFAPAGVAPSGDSQAETPPPPPPMAADEPELEASMADSYNQSVELDDAFEAAQSIEQDSSQTSDEPDSSESEKDD